MQISFYVLGERYQQLAVSQHGNPSDEINTTAAGVDTAAVFDFLCKLTQTVLQKSEHRLLIVDDNLERLQRLDDYLWTFDPTSFITHDLLDSNINNSNKNSSNSANETDLQTKNPQTEETQANTLSAPVTLSDTLPTGFDGVVLNLAADALPLKNNAHLPQRVLEIITPDETSKEQGREKYKHYRDLGFELIYHPIE